VVAVEGICIPWVALGRSRVIEGAGRLFLKSRAENEWVYLSLSPDIYTLEDFWEESAALGTSLEDLQEGWGG
jgi:hypothetical protein